MTEAIGLGARPAERLGPVTLIREGITRLAEAPVAFGLIWLVWGGLVAAAQVGARIAGVSLTVFSTQPVFLASTAGMIVGTGLFGALALRAAVQGQTGLLRIDAGLLHCAGLLALGQVATTASTLLLVGSMTTAGEDVMTQLALVLGALALLGVLAWILSKLLLWPIGQLMGRRDVTPARSWTLMRRAMLGWIAANILLLIPLVVALFASAVGAPGGPDGDINTIASAFANQFWVQFGQVMAAVVYAHRVDASARLVAMFD